MIKEVLRSLQEKATGPHERCGLLDSGYVVYDIPNVAADKTSSFAMDKSEYYRTIKTIESLGRTVAAVWHTHPSGDPSPSKEDLASAKRLGILYLIVTQNSYKIIGA